MCAPQQCARVDTTTTDILTHQELVAESLHLAMRLMLHHALYKCLQFLPGDESTDIHGITHGWDTPVVVLSCQEKRDCTAQHCHKT